MKGYSQDVVANSLEISVRAYSKLERGETQLTVERLYKIAEILEIPVQDVLGFEVNNVFNNSPYQQGGSYVAYNNTDIEHVKSLYERLLKNKDDLITLLKES